MARVNVHEIGIVLQGPTTHLTEVVACYAQHPHVVWSTWQDEPAESLERIRGSGIALVTSAKPSPAGYMNCVLQCHSTYQGIKHFQHSPEIKAVVKIRSDVIMTDLPRFLADVAEALRTKPMAFMGRSCSYLHTWYVWDLINAGLKTEMLRFWEPAYGAECGLPYPEEWLQQRYFRWRERGMPNDHVIPEEVAYIRADLRENVIWWLKYRTIMNDPILHQELAGTSWVNGFPPAGEATLRIERLQELDFDQIEQVQQSMSEDWCLWLREGEEITAEQITAMMPALSQPTQAIYTLPMFYEEVPGYLTCRLEPRVLRRGVSLTRMETMTRDVLNVPLAGTEPTLTPPWITEAHRLCARGDMGAVINLTRSVSAQSMPEAAVRVKWLALALVQTGRLADAVPLLLQASREHPASSDLHYLLGKALSGQNEVAAAQDALLRAKATAAANPLFEFFYNTEELCDAELAWVQERLR